MNIKWDILQENFNAGLKTITKVVPNRPQLPILSSVLITATETEITLAVTDLTIGIKTTIPAKVEQTGTIAVPAKLLSDMVSSFQPGKIHLEADDTTLTITAGKTKSTIAIQPADDFPELVSPQGKETIIQLEQLESLHKYVVFSAATDMARPVLATVSCRQEADKPGVLCAATDGFRLSLKQFSDLSLPQEELLIPLQALQEAYRIAQQQEADTISLQVSPELQQLFLTISNTEIFIRLVEGAYPPYQKIVPSNFTYEAIIDAEQLLHHVKQSLIFARETSNVVQFTFKEDQLHLSGSSTAAGSFEATMPVQNQTGKEGTIAFNGKYVVDLLNSIKPSEMWFGMSDTLKPALFADPSKEVWQHVIMPFRLNEA